MERMLKRQRGLTVLGILVFLVIFGVIYGAYIYAPVIIDYYVAKEVLQKTVNMAYSQSNDQFLKEDCDRRLQHAGLPVLMSQCTIERGPSNTYATVKYTYEPIVKFVPTNIERLYKVDISVTQDLTQGRSR